jgi:hypothetical protein
MLCEPKFKHKRPLLIKPKDGRSPYWIFPIGIVCTGCGREIAEFCDPETDQDAVRLAGMVHCYECDAAMYEEPLKRGHTVNGAPYYGCVVCWKGEALTMLAPLGA